ncbi:hypothetical protein [Winogradskyella sediminis]|uniref:Uncharacterized protein n=1 Tax=Winogradskyella sediminis TaxID=1382466 RepID=A0A1H1QXH5_9FLAO|nr:hypothetical protein [Winogradskyella sediminis]REG89686.1 hypothetical protein C8N41_101929 [Winogradskyella sediminis]SDS27579.1 hypothetical protein SAMN04489797_1248 [Winogradskyella sediminis]
MIVNPQLFNYRLIISSLLVVLTVLGVYSFDKYKSIESYEEFLEQEKVLIETELSELLLSYDDLNEDYNYLTSQLQDAKLEASNALDSLKLLKGDLSIVTKYKEQLVILKSKNTVLLNAMDSLNSANVQLKTEKQLALNTIQNNSKTISGLEEANDSLYETIELASSIRGSNINVESYKLKSGKKRLTNKAKRVNAIDVCITLNENPLANKGKKDIYIQIVSPQGNVVADKGELFYGDTSLNYSHKETVNYNQDNLEICTAIVAGNEDQPFSKGYYFINVFHENMKLASTSLNLK